MMSVYRMECDQITNVEDFKVKLIEDFRKANPSVHEIKKIQVKNGGDHPGPWLKVHMTFEDAPKNVFWLHVFYTFMRYGEVQWY